MSDYTPEIAEMLRRDILRTLKKVLPFPMRLESVVEAVRTQPHLRGIPQETLEAELSIMAMEHLVRMDPIGLAPGKFTYKLTPEGAELCRREGVS